MRSRKLTIKDVAAEAGVSVASVSRVLNAVPSVDEAIRLKVQAAVDRLDYRPDSMARGLRRQSNTIIGLTVPDIGAPFVTAVVRGAEDGALASGHLLVLCNTDDDIRKEASYLGQLAGQAVAGMLVIPADEEHTSVDRLLDRGIPVVSVDRRLRRDDVDSVLVNNVEGAEQAVRHLISRGCTRLATIAGPERTTTGSGRLQGFRSGVARAGAVVSEELVVDGGFTIDGGARAAARLLDLPEPPDGLFVANSAMAVGAIEALTQRGLEPGRDLPLVCFDELPRGVDPHHRIVVVAQPGYDVGRTAIDLLLARIAGDSSPARSVLIQPTLREGSDQSRQDVPSSSL